jgi:hypothetical protein
MSDILDTLRLVSCQNFFDNRGFYIFLPCSYHTPKYIVLQTFQEFARKSKYLLFFATFCPKIRFTTQLWVSLKVLLVCLSAFLPCEKESLLRKQFHKIEMTWWLDSQHPFFHTKIKLKFFQWLTKMVHIFFGCGMQQLQAKSVFIIQNSRDMTSRFFTSDFLTMNGLLLN